MESGAKSHPCGFYRFSPAQIEVYLERIGSEGVLEPSDKNLNALHQAHLGTVVFENLDIHLGRSIELDIPKIFDKVVVRGRGGFCYELNSLFGSLLYSLGFDIRLHAAQVIKNGVFHHPFGHICLSVSGDRDWLVDVGFGASFLEPLLLQDGLVQRDDAGEHVLNREENAWILSSQIYSQAMDPQYRMDATVRHLGEFRDQCRWTQTSPESNFTRRMVATKPIGNGRKTVLGLDFLTFLDGVPEERPITPHERSVLLAKDFDLPEADVLCLPSGIEADRL